MSLRAIWAFDGEGRFNLGNIRGQFDELPPRGHMIPTGKDVDPKEAVRLIATLHLYNRSSLWLFEDGWCRSVVYFQPEKELVVGIPGPEGKKYLEKVLGME